MTPAAAPAESSRKADAIVPVAIIGILLMMVLPLPAWLLDALLACSLALAVGIFLTALFIESALEFSAFPAFVLVATLLRLSLNVATTRLILLHGGEGQGAAGDVVEAFGRFVVEGNVVVGLVIFLILVVINFVVITKGSGRVAEVAARFTLDAMPGKQMAVDADLASGVLTPEVARQKRKDLEREADFYGAMDGASKFVHGDAIAGLLITAINLLGGLVLGVAGGMSVSKAAETFTVLSVGDALVSQLPALLVSSAAGIVVTRSATGEQLGRAFTGQLLSRKRPMTLTAGILTLLGLMPGMPFLPCVCLAAALLFAVRKPAAAGAVGSKGGAETGAKAGTAEEARKNDSADVETALSVDLLSLELGYELVGLVDVARGGTLLERVASLRQQLARECGVVVPPVNVCDNLELAPGAYRVLVSGVEVAAGTCRSGFLLALDPSGTAPPIDGEATIDPAFGAPARWISPRDREMAEALGYAVVDEATVLATHLGEILRAQGHKLLGRQEVQHLLEVLARRSPKLVDDVVPNMVPVGDLVRILRNLLREHVSIRDLRSILEALAEIAPQTKDPEQLTEFLRERLSPQITARAKGADGGVTALTLDPRLEELLRRSLRDIAAGTGGAIDPNVLNGVTASAERSLAQFAALGAPPIVVCPPDLRRYVRAIVERKTPQLAVVSFREIDPSVTLRVLGSLAAGAANERQGALPG